MSRRVYCCKNCGNKICTRTALYGCGGCNFCYRNNRTGKNNPNYKGFIKLNCNYCNKNIFRLPCRIKPKNYCNIRCLIFDLKKQWKTNKNPSFGQRRIPNLIKYKANYFRSGWEANFAKWCDLSGIEWKYESKTFILGNNTYTPDFYLPEFDCYIEIKGWFKTKAKQKFLRFKRMFPKIQIHLFDKKKCRELGLFDA